MTDELPEGWTRCRVEDLFCSFSGGTPSKDNRAYWGGKIPWLSSGDIKADRISVGSEFITQAGLGNSSSRLCRPGAVLIVVRSGILRHTLPVSVLAQQAAINQDIKCFDSGRDDLNSWFALALRAFSKDILALNREGTTVQSVKYDTLRHFQLPIPPLPEQRRIAEKLEKLLAEVEQCKGRMAKIPVLLKRFRQSVLAAACSGRLTADWRKDETYENNLPVSWKYLQLEKLLPPGGIFDGPFGSNLKTSDYRDSGVRVIRLENIGHLRFISEKETYVSQKKYQSLRKHTVGEGDIIFASFIDEEIRVCVLPELKTPAIAKADCFCLRPKPELVDRRYLTYQLASRESYDALFEDVHGATRPRINTTQLRKLDVRVCSLAEQQEIVHRVEALFALAGRIEERYQGANRQVDSLTQSILAKAFRGELVPTEAELAARDGRDYESAAQLLQRIDPSATKRSPRGASRRAKL